MRSPCPPTPSPDEATKTVQGSTCLGLLEGAVPPPSGLHKSLPTACSLWAGSCSEELGHAIRGQCIIRNHCLCVEQVIKAGWVLPAVLACRALVGLGEGVVMPSMNTLMATRVPATWRSSALGIVYSGFHAGQQPAAWIHAHDDGQRAIQARVGMGIEKGAAWGVCSRGIQGQSSPVV